MNYGAALVWNLDIFKYAYWDNRVHMTTDYSPQVRHVGWQWEFGVRLGHFDVLYKHHSQHSLDYENPRGDAYPLEDMYGVRIHLIGGR